MEKIKKLVFLLRLEAFVEFAGPVPYERIRGLLEKNDIFVLPSYYEGVPLALLEAMACGKAVVFSDIPASYGLISDGVDGILVRPDDFSGLAAALERLIRDVSYRYALGKKAQAKGA
jgi:glycosyltransferase involved in cell wall biosynthesis